MSLFLCMVLGSVLILFQFYSFTCSCPVFPASLIEEIVLSSIVYFCLLCHRLGSHGALVYLWTFCPVPLIYISVFVPVPYCFDCQSFILWSQIAWFLQLCFSFSRLLWILGVFCVSIWIIKVFVLIVWEMPLIIW